MSDRNLIVRFFSAVWGGADAVRKVLHLALLLLIFFVFIGALSGGAPRPLPSKAALVISPAGALVEQMEGDPVDRAISEAMGDGRPQTVVKDIVDALEYARDDDRIEAVHLDLGGMSGGGLAKLRRIAAAIEDFRVSGKPVIASADFLGQQTYYLAAHADEVYLHPDGLLFLQGFGSYRNYYKDAIDKLRIDWNVFRVGTHKSFVEPFTRMDMSDEDRETRARLLEQLWALYREGVVAARGLDEGAVQAYADNLLENIRAADGDFASTALENGLVDGLLNHAELRGRLIELVGEDRDRPDTYSAAGMQEYLAQMRLLAGGTVGEENVAIIVASGEILFGSQPPGLVGGDSTSELLRAARNDESVRAVVLRVDSPGGSAFAAELISDEIKALQADGKPVVASMSSVAASGGYVISMDADRIFASPASITGSIGVFAMLPTFQRSIAALGIATDGVGTTPWAGQLRPDRAMSEEAKALVQLGVEDTYDDFISDVAASREMDKADVDRIGQGQVWTGLDALENGLVDELGELEDAVAAAAELAGLDDYGLKYIEQELTPTQQFIIDLVGSAHWFGVDLRGLLPQPSAIERIAGGLAEQAESMLRFNDPKGIYSHCFCDFMSN
ncbi:MAG TPA: signal peptide peptidase SppA [Woeseiaceae bacterium]|nr:signal peptide peptidase SppA [Woeseiaceae bacterium]